MNKAEDPAAFAGPEDVALTKFREVRDQIRHRIEAWLDERSAPPAEQGGDHEQRT